MFKNLNLIPQHACAFIPLEPDSGALNRPCDPAGAVPFKPRKGFNG